MFFFIKYFPICLIIPTFDLNITEHFTNMQTQIVIDIEIQHLHTINEETFNGKTMEYTSILFK